METEELIKLVDGIYKNILDKFNPGARQMINAGKAYLKALHGAAAASRLYVDAIGKLAKQAQQGTWGGSSDIGMALMKIVEVYKEIQDQQMNILKAFYVDLLVPLETNLEKDTKVVQSEQKRFLQQHKQRSETYSKAAAMMKKQRKKSRSSSKTGLAMDKELKNMQVLEEEKTKLDAFCEQSLKNAMTQERRRYGFVLERHCSLAKHYLSYHNQGVQVYQQNIEKWSEVAKTREYLPESVENIFSNRIRQISVWQDEDLYSNPRSPHFDDDDRISINSQLRKTKSMDASCLDIRSIEEASSPINTLSRAKSEYNLNSSTHSLVQSETPTRRPKSMAVPPPPAWDTQLARALYAYLSSGDNQLSFLEGDLISLIGDRNKGWQFGENLRTQCSGWFPLAYTEIIDDSSFSPSHSSVQHPHHHHHQHQHQQAQSNNATPTNSGGPSLPGVAATNANHRNSGGNNNASSLESNAVPPRMFGDTLHLHRSSASAKQFRRAIGSNNIPPPALPAPVPTPSLPYHKQTMTQSQSANFGLPSKLMHVPPSSSSMTTTSTPTGDASSTFQSPYSQPTIKSSQSTFNFSTSGAAGTSTSAYSTHPQPAARGVPGGAQSDRPQTGAVVPLPLHLQTTKSTKIGGGPVGNVSLHSSNDSGFSNDPPPQPEIDYSDDESIQGQTKLPARRNTMHRISDNNNNKLRKSAGLSPMSSASSTIRPSNSSGNLIERRSYYDTESLQEKKVKRTKSFWRFGKAANDHEILEGMSMWKHRDLVDLMMMDDAQKAKNVKSKSTHDQNNNATQKKKKSTTQNSSNKKKKSSSDKMRRDGSNDSDRTMINAKPGDDQVTREMNGKTLRAYAEKMSESQRTSFIEKTRQQQHQHQQQQQREEPRDRRASEMKRQAAKNGNRFDDDDDEEDDEEEEDEAIDEFYDDGDDGLMLRTVNRKNILQQYTNDSTGSDSGSESEMTSDDPYDCILVDDQKVSKRQYPDVHAIGKKLEKLSKSTKYTDTIEKKKNAENLKHNSNGGVNSNNNNNNNNGTSSTFKTFGIGLTDEDNRKEQQHTQNHHHKQQEQKDSDGYYKEKGGYANGTLTNKRTQQAQDKEKLKYYAERRRDSIADDYSDATESRQFLPRTKLHKTNSGNNSNKYENESSLMEYGETLPRRLKSPDRGTTFDEKSPHTGNMYGPWYDLWGLDASVRK